MKQTAKPSVLAESRGVRRAYVLGSLILGMFMAAIEGTIVATAMPDIVAHLGGFSLYSWVFSAFLLMQAVTILIFGKLADLFGRKPVFVVGVVIFLLGSILCGFASSMALLIAFRFLQGIGAGAVQPIALTIVGDLYNLEERARIQGYLSGVWGISAVIGPLVGGLIVQYAHWSWIFWLNIPFGVLTILGVGVFFHEQKGTRRGSIDYAGAGLFVLAIASLMIVLIQGGTAWRWASPQVGLLVGVFALGTVLFLWREGRALEPMMPLAIWRHRLIALANSATLTAGMIIIGLNSFLPTYVQGVMGYSAVVAGFTLTAMSVGWPLASTLAGHLLVRLGPRPLARAGGLALVAGAQVFVFLDPAKGPLWAATGSLVIGVGMGLTSTTFLVSIQNSVGRQTRGIATASNMFMRILGTAVGAALLGGVLNSTLARYLAERDADLSVDSLRSLLGAPGAALGADARVLQHGLALGLHHVYWVVFAFAGFTLLISLFLPRARARS